MLGVSPKLDPIAIRSRGACPRRVLLQQAQLRSWPMPLEEVLPRSENGERTGRIRPYDRAQLFQASAMRRVLRPLVVSVAPNEPGIGHEKRRPENRNPPRGIVGSSRI